MAPWRRTLDLLVNCASVFAYDEPAATDAAIFQEAMAVNLRAPMRLAERCMIMSWRATAAAWW